MSQRPLSVRLDEAIVADQLRLPLYPASARQGLDLLAAGTPSLEALAELISHDPVLTCTLFRAANSAFYEGLPKVAGIGEAVARIGLDPAGEVLRSVCSEALAAPPGPLLSGYLPVLWQHSQGCALGARWLAERCGYQVLAEQAQLAGLLHDIGKFLLLAGLQRVAAEEGAAALLGAQLVEEVLASRHVAEGLRLQTAWNLPDAFAEVIGRHHHREAEGLDLVVALVRLANQGCHKLGLGWASDPLLVLPTTAEAQFLGIDEIALAEFEIMLEDYFGMGTGDDRHTVAAGLDNPEIVANTYQQINPNPRRRL